VVSRITGRTQIERVYENRMLKKIFRLKKDEVTGGFKKVHDEDFNNLHSSPNRPCYKDNQMKEY
jgi:hypothetical protein